jgi:hypothetical protein
MPKSLSRTSKLMEPKINPGLNGKGVSGLYSKFLIKNIQTDGTKEKTIYQSFKKNYLSRKARRFPPI